MSFYGVYVFFAIIYLIYSVVIPDLHGNSFLPHLKAQVAGEGYEDDS